MLKLLIADDSALMRKCLSEIFKAEGDFDVMVARNGAEALALAHSFGPDVITLDVNMPEMDGITCLSRIMAECPKPVVMVSSLTSEGAEVTLQAIDLGAIDFIPKPDGTVSLHLDKIRGPLVAKVRSAAKARIRLRRSRPPSAPVIARSLTACRPGTATTSRIAAGQDGFVPQAGGVRGLVLIGVSTGGPGAIEAILPRLERNFPWPILIAQHMPQSFTGVFARRINTLSQLEVVEVTRPLQLVAGVAYIGRGDADILVSRRGAELTAITVPASPHHNWHPSVERLVESALELVDPKNLLGVMLTGMGDDGASAMTTLRNRGGRTIAESEASAIVWGMPGELVKRGGASLVLPLERMADQLRRWTQ
jgi:two-component system chemotaxis response regulator CheB